RGRERAPLSAGAHGAAIPDRAGRCVLRLSDEAAAVPGPLPRQLPARRGESRGDDPARCAADAAMKLYLRLLGFLRPHAGVFALSVVAMIIFAALDVSSFILLAPFLAVLFRAEEAAVNP